MRDALIVALLAVACSSNPAGKNGSDLTNAGGASGDVGDSGSGGSAGRSGASSSSNDSAGGRPDGTGGQENATFARSSSPRIGASAVDPAALAEATQANTRFAFDVYRALAAREDNLFFSPFSLSTAMAMAWGGAAGSTAAEIRDVFHFGEGASTHAAIAALDELASVSSPTVTMAFANALFTQSDVRPKETFLELLATNYGAGVGLVDFKRADDAAEIIDVWVREQTQGSIPKLLDSMDLAGGTKAVLVNATSFKASWSVPFNPLATSDATFHLGDGTTSTVKLMGTVAEFRYVATDDCDAVALPYRGSDTHHYELVAVLPKTDLPSLEKVIDSPWFERLLAGMKTALVDVAMPRFEIRSALHLKDTLTALGMPTAFIRNAADFSGIAEDLFISDVVHQGFSSVDERGTVATAATAVVFAVDGGVGAETGAPKPFILNRPFLAFIRHVESGTVVFMGRIAKP